MFNHICGSYSKYQTTEKYSIGNELEQLKNIQVTQFNPHPVPTAVTYRKNKVSSRNGGGAATASRRRDVNFNVSRRKKDPPSAAGRMAEGSKCRRYSPRLFVTSLARPQQRIRVVGAHARAIAAPRRFFCHAYAWCLRVDDLDSDILVPYWPYPILAHGIVVKNNNYKTHVIIIIVYHGRGTLRIASFKGITKRF